MTHSEPRKPGILAPSVVWRLLAIFLPAPLLLGGVVLILYYQDLANEKILYEQAGGHLVDLHEDIITRELRSVESDLLYLANQAILRDFLSGRDTTRKELQDEYVLFCRHKGLYDQIRYLDITGLEQIRVNYNNGTPSAVADQELQSKAGRYYFSRTMLLKRGEVFISPFDLNVEHDEIERPFKPVIRLATPVFDRRGTKRGVLVLNYLGAALIQKLAAVSVSFPGSAVLLNQGGYFLHGTAPEEEWGFMLGKETTFVYRYPEEWEKLTRLVRGQFHTARGLFTFCTISPSAEIAAERQSPRTATPPEGDDPDANDASLLVVSVVPHAVMYGRSDQLFQRILLVYGVALVLVLILAWYLAFAGALRRYHERQIAASENRLRKLSTQLITAQEDERRSLSRDLHDELGQVATSIMLDLQRAVPKGADAKTTELIARALHGAECLLERLHEIVARIRPTLLDDLGLKDAVQNYLSEYQRATGILPVADLQFETRDIPGVVSENLFRILQEALTNVAKHARVREVSVKLTAAAGRVTLTVRDEGVGFTQELLNGKGLGMLGMRERAELLNGSFVAQSEPGKGTQIQVTLPLREK